MIYAEISLFWVVTRVIGCSVTDVSGHRIVSVFNSQDFQKKKQDFFLDICPEMFVTNQPTPRNDPEARRSELHRSESRNLAGIRLPVLRGTSTVIPSIK
jgi:uncharacterized protein YbbK (DUF523 family)